MKVHVCENWRDVEGRLRLCGERAIYRVHFPDGMTATLCAADACVPYGFHLVMDLNDQSREGRNGPDL